MRTLLQWKDGILQPKIREWCMLLATTANHGNRACFAELMKMKMDKITLDAGLFNDLLATAKILHQKADGVNPDFLKSSGRVIAECERVLEEANHQNNIFLAQQLIDDLAQQDETSHGKSPL